MLSPLEMVLNGSELKWPYVGGKKSNVGNLKFSYLLYSNFIC